MHQGSDDALRTRVYIDGYNLYYGCLRNSSYKWMDVRALAEHILSNVPYECGGRLVGYRFQAPAIKYFTASILKAFARSGDSVSSQAHYCSALEGHLGSQLQIVRGYYDARPARAHRWEEGKVARECDKIDIWKLEEKQSDVSLALHAFSDAVRNEIEQIIVVTNDTDFAPAMQLIRRQTNAVLGLIAPIREGDGQSRVNRELRKYANWTRSYILDEELAASQLPPMVRHEGGVIHKPLSWYPRPDLLAPIYEEARRVKGSHGAARKWLNQPCAHLGGRIPIDMCSVEETAFEVRNYMDGYARQFAVRPSSVGAECFRELQPCFSVRTQTDQG